MEPQIKDKDKVLVSSIPYFFSKPKEGDVVAFWYFDKVLIKKIKVAKKLRYLAEGENVSDSLRIGWIEKKDIIGKVIYKL